MFNGLLCALQQEPEEQMVDSDLRALTEEHVANLYSEPEPGAGKKLRLNMASLVWMLARLRLRNSAND